MVTIIEHEEFLEWVNWLYSIALQWIPSNTCCSSADYPMFIRHECPFLVVHRNTHIAISSIGIYGWSDVCFCSDSDRYTLWSVVCFLYISLSSSRAIYVCMHFTCIFQLIVELESLPKLVLLMLRRLCLSDWLSLPKSPCSCNFNSIEFLL